MAGMYRSKALLVFVSILGLGGLAPTGCNGDGSSPSGEPAGPAAAAQPAAAQPAAAPAQPAQPAAQPAQPAQPAATPAATPPAGELAPVETDPRKADLALLCQTLRACWQEEQASGRCHGDEPGARLRGLALKRPESRDLRDLLIASGAQGPAVDELGKALQLHGVACHLAMPGASAEGTTAGQEASPAQEATPPAQEATPPPAP